MGGRGVLGLLVAAMIGLAGCIRQPVDPTVLSADTAPPSIAESGKAFVIVTVEHVDRTGLIPIPVPSHASAYFLNLARSSVQDMIHPEPGNGFLTAANGRLDVFQINPGTYVLTDVTDQRSHFGFGVAQSPVRFHVSAGEVVYLGDLLVTEEETLSYGLVTAKRKLVSLDVTDGFLSIGGQAATLLSVLPQAPQIQTRLLTILRSPVEMSGRKPGFY